MKRDAGGRSARERGGPPVCLPRFPSPAAPQGGDGRGREALAGCAEAGRGEGGGGSLLIARPFPSVGGGAAGRPRGLLPMGLAGEGGGRPPARLRPAPAGPDPFHIPQWGEKNPPRFVPEAEWDRGGKRPLPLSQAGGAVGSRFPEGRGFWFFFFCRGWYFSASVT